jgi:hypothetical protein
MSRYAGRWRDSGRTSWEPSPMAVSHYGNECSADQPIRSRAAQ